MNNRSKKNRKKFLEDQLARANGIFRMKPTWVARNSMPSGQRLGLPENQYYVGERGWISERWLGSTTKADNLVGPADEGLTYLNLPLQHEITLKEAVEIIPDLLMGKEYSKSHSGLGRLAKIFDMRDRIAFHFHQQMKDARLVGRNSKEEAYYFPEGVDMGPHPETFFGVHPSLAQLQNREKLIPHLIEWKDDQILQYSRAYQQYPDDGFHVPAGIPHAPGTALTLELQEDSDVFAILQAKSGNDLIPKELLFKDVRKEDREKFGERIILDQIDWELSSDPYFYENRHTPPLLIQSSIQEGGQEHWIFYNSTKFSGKKMVIMPGLEYSSVERGVYNLLVWQGEGYFDGIQLKAGDFNMDELLVSHDKAIQLIGVKNTGNTPLVIFKFFGPDINPDVPMIKPFK
jgi:hypothetical protein